MDGDIGWWGVPLAMLGGAIRVSTPFLFVSLGECLTEKSGRINLSLEGTLVMGAMSAYAVSLFTGSPWLGVLVAAMAGFVLGGAHAAICNLPRVNDIGTGIALMLFATGLAFFLGKPFIQPKAPGLPSLDLGWWSSSPQIRAALQVNALFILGVVLAPVMTWMFAHTRLGLVVRVAGDSADAARAIGTSVERVRFIATAAGTGDAHFLGTADEPVADKFRCIAQIGLGNGNVELTADAMLASLDGDGPGACNVGFARDDALLVIVNITDTDDPSAYPPGAGSAGDPAAWFAQLVALRGGMETNVVMISILPPTSPTCTVEGNWSPLLPGALDAPRLTELTQMFTHHYIGDICAADYGVLLGEALAAIETGCDDYSPPG